MQTNHEEHYQEGGILMDRDISGSKKKARMLKP